MAGEDVSPDFRAAVARASDSVVRNVESEPWPPAAVQSVTPATENFG